MSLDSKPSLCFLCNKDLFSELLLKCYFSEFQRDRTVQSLDALPSKKAHFLCSLFFSELELVIQNREAFLKGGQKIKSGHYLEECQICSLDAMGACLIKCAFEYFINTSLINFPSGNAIPTFTYIACCPTKPNSSVSNVKTAASGSFTTAACMSHPTPWLWALLRRRFPRPRPTKGTI